MRRNVEPTGEPKGQGNDQGVEANGGVDGVPDFSMIIGQQLQNLLPTILAQVGNQGDNMNQSALPSMTTSRIQEMESVQDMSGCGDDQKVKYTTGSFVGKALTWWNYQIHTRSHEVVVSMACDDFKVLMREEFCPSKEM
ncbi:hypothetical protein Tco_1473285 [Tanacetum coccineum]